MNHFKLENLFCKSALSFLFAIFLILILLGGVAIAVEAPIINGKTKMAPGEQQILSLMNYQTGNTYTWSVQSGAGILSANSGQSVTFTAPTSNPNCVNTPVISVSVNGGAIGSITIAINQYSGNSLAFVTSCTFCGIYKKGQVMIDGNICETPYAWCYGTWDDDFNCKGNFIKKTGRGGMGAWDYYPDFCKSQCLNPFTYDVIPILIQ